MIREMPCSMSAFSLLKRNGPDAVLQHWLALTETGLERRHAMADFANIPIPDRFSNTYYDGGGA